jgi:hypothetical protein
MARIGSAMATGPFFEPSFTDEVFDQIEAAPKPFEAQREFRLSAELRSRVIAAVKDYVRDRAALDQATTWKELRALIEPVAKRSKDLTKALEGLTASHGEEQRKRLAMYHAEELLGANYSPDGLNIAEFLVQMYRLRVAAQRALDACDRKRGRDLDDALLICIGELKAVYAAAGGRSIKPRTVWVQRSQDVVETKQSGFVLFLHECLNTLPAEIYAYAGAHPNNSTGLAKQVARHFRPTKNGQGRRFIADAIADARLRWAAKGDQNSSGFC